MEVPVLLLIPSLMCGGAERVLISLANDLHSKGYQVTLVSINSETPAYLINDGINTVYLVKRKYNTIVYRIYYGITILYKLVALLLEIKPTCVISFITSANVFIGLASCFTGTKYIVSERTSPNRTINKLGYLHKIVAAMVYKRAKAVVVGCKGIEQCLLSNNSFKSLNNIHKIANSFSEFGPIGNKLVHERKFILAVGRLTYVKGFDILIEAFGKCNIEDLDLLIVGDGEELTNLMLLIKRFGLGKRVFLLGAKTNLQDFYSQAEQFVLPSRNEGYPNALIEAMSFGCPCIASNCEFGPSEIISHGHNGILVPLEDTNSLAESIIRLHHNPELRASLSIQSSLIKKTNDPHQLFKKWEDLVIL